MLYNKKLGYSLKWFCSLWPHCPKNTLITNFWRGLQKTTIKWRRIKECIVTFKPHRSLSQSMDMRFFNSFHLMTFPYDAVRKFRFIFLAIFLLIHCPVRECYPFDWFVCLYFSIALLFYFVEFMLASACTHIQQECPHYSSFIVAHSISNIQANYNKKQWGWSCWRCLINYLQGKKL